MPYVVCAVDERDSEDAVRAAIEFCLEQEADLRLVGVVKDKLSDSTRATAGERIRRYNAVKLQLDSATNTARAAGVRATTTVRAGDLSKEVLAEAEAVGSGELFFVRTRGRIRAAISRKPRKETVHLSFDASTVAELARAA
jgi:hypothetical protein